MTILLIVLGSLALVVLCILGIAATKPDKFVVQRSTTVSAPPDRVFPLLNDFHAWSGWSPWEKLDPAMNRTHSGAPNGKGAIYEWEGNKKVGKGRMEISESVPARKVVLDLHFMAPWEAKNVTEFSLEPQGDATKVVWEMRGQHAFMGKVMGVFMSMDAMIGKDFERGLSSIKELAEND